MIKENVAFEFLFEITNKANLFLSDFEKSSLFITILFSKMLCTTTPHQELTQRKEIHFLT